LDGKKDLKTKTEGTQENSSLCIQIFNR